MRGIWSNMRKRYMEEELPEEYARMSGDGTLDEYLSGIEAEYKARFSRMVDERVEKSELERRYSEGLPQMEYVGEYNMIREEVREFLMAELCL